MKVGYILKREIKNIPGLQSPYKIIVNDNYRYHSRQKLENVVLLEYCKTFLNDLPGTKSLRKHKSFFQKKKIKNNSLLNKNYSHFSKKSQNCEKNLISSIDSDNLPFLGNSSSKTKRKIYIGSNKKLPNIFEENILIKNKIKYNINYSINNSKKDNKLIKSSVFYDRKKEKEHNNNYTIQTQISQEKKINHINNYFNSKINKNKSNNSNKNINNKRTKTKMQTIFEYRIQKRIKNMNNIIDKLNTPIFMYNKNDIN